MSFESTIKFSEQYEGFCKEYRRINGEVQVPTQERKKPNNSNKGKQAKRRKLSNKDIKKIFQMFAEGKTKKEIITKFSKKVSKSVIYAILRGVK